MMNAEQIQLNVRRFFIFGLRALPFCAAVFVLTVGGCRKSNDGPSQATNGKLAPLLPAPATATTETVRRDSWRKFDDPSADGWDSEVLAKHAKAQLDRLGPLLFNPGDVTELVAAGFACDPLVPKNLVTVFEDDIAKVERGARSDQPRGNVAELVGAFQHVRSDDAQFEFKITKVIPGQQSTFKTEQLFSLSFRTESTIVEHHAKWNIVWQRDDETAKLIDIRVTEFARTTTKAPRPLFSDCTESALAANACFDQQLAHGMNHWLSRLPVRAMLNRFGTPGVAVGDVNGDGLDDLYLCQEPGLPNRLFLQNSDGTAREVASEWGVDWIDDSRAALLVDLDNDGDQDLAVAIYSNVVVARNDGEKRFTIVAAMPASSSTASLAAADFDSDGRLDLFVCGYVQEDGGASMGAAASRFVYHNAENGAANSLFRNEGEFEFADVTSAVGLNRNNNRWSFAASWEDYDGDGDQDLYVANDYGPNNLYRNDFTPEHGGRTFVDVAAQVGVEDSASGMSVSWGDYNRDGHMDIYVSNMFSAAGNRITTQNEFRTEATDELRTRFRRFARGNSLFRQVAASNADSSFEDVSLSAHVNLGRWAWGSNFIDLNNDAWQDLVVANGYLSSSEDSGDL